MLRRTILGKADAEDPLPRKYNKLLVSASGERFSTDIPWLR